MTNKEVKVTASYLIFNAICWLIVLGISIYQLKEEPKCPSGQQKQTKCVEIEGEANDL